MAENLQTIVDDLEDCLSEVASLLEQALKAKNWDLITEAFRVIEEMTEPEAPEAE